MAEGIIQAVQFLLLPQSGNISPLQQPLPCHGDGNLLINQIYRVVAEIRTRSEPLSGGKKINDINIH